MVQDDARGVKDPGKGKRNKGFYNVWLNLIKEIHFVKLIFMKNNFC